MVSISQSEPQTEKVKEVRKRGGVGRPRKWLQQAAMDQGKGSNWQGIKVSQKLLNCQKNTEEIVSVNTFRVEYFGVLSSLLTLILRVFQDNKFSNCAVLQLPVDLSFFYFWYRAGKNALQCVCISSERSEISWGYLDRTLFLFMSYTERNFPLFGWMDFAWVLFLC